MYVSAFKDLAPVRFRGRSTHVHRWNLFFVIEFWEVQVTSWAEQTRGLVRPAFVGQSCAPVVSVGFRIDGATEDARLLHSVQIYPEFFEGMVNNVVDAWEVYLRWPDPELPKLGMIRTAQGLYV